MYNVVPNLITTEQYLFLRDINQMVFLCMFIYMNFQKFFFFFFLFSFKISKNKFKKNNLLYKGKFSFIMSENVFYTVVFKNNIFGNLFKRDLFIYILPLSCLRRVWRILKLSEIIAGVVIGKYFFFFIICSFKCTLMNNSCRRTTIYSIKKKKKYILKIV